MTESLIASQSGRILALTFSLRPRFLASEASGAPRIHSLSSTSSVLAAWKPCSFDGNVRPWSTTSRSKKFEKQKYFPLKLSIMVPSSFEHHQDMDGNLQLEERTCPSRW